MAWKRITSIVLLLCLLLSSFAMPGIGAASVDKAESGAKVELAETGANVSDGTIIYFDASNVAESGAVIQFMIGHGSWSQGYPMTKVSNSNLYYVKMPLWEGASEYAIFGCNEEWGGEGSSVSSRKSWAPWSTSVMSAVNLSGTVVLTANSSGTLSQSSGSLNTTHTATACYQSSGGGSYSTGTTGGTVKVSGYNVSGTTGTAKSSSTSGTGISAGIGTSVTMTATAKAGYTFIGWYSSTTASSATSTSASYTYTNTGTAKTLYAKFQLNGPYTVTVQTNSTSYGTVSASSTSVYYGKTTTLTATPKTGYHLSSWAITSGTGSLSSTTALKPTLTVNSKVTVKATFAANTGKVTFSAGTGGSVSSTGGSTTYSGTKSSTASASTGYYFTGWTISGGTLNTDYKITSGSTSSTSITIQPITQGASITCKANFSAQYKITTQVNYPVLGSVTKSVTYVTPGNTVTITASPTTGNRFNKWTFPSGSYSYTSGSATSTSITIKPTSNVTVQGNFQAGLTVSAGSGGSVSPSGTNYYEYNTSVTLTATPSTGYHFTGWTFGGTYGGSPSTSSSSTTIKVQNNTTAKASFAINTYTVTFKDWNGTVLATKTVNHGASATAPSNPVRAGYEFTGWSGTYTNVTSNQTVTATYKDIQYYLMGDMNSWGGTVMSESGNIASVTVHLEPGTYKFKLTKDGTWWGNGGTIVDTTLNTSSVGWEMSTSAGDCTLQAFGGDYTFNFNKSTGFLEVIYNPDRFTVSFFNWDGTMLKSDVVMKGNNATPPSTPTKAGNAQYSYTFSGWDKSYTNVQSTLDIHAQFTQVTNKYTVTFKNWDGTVLKTQSVEYGSNATAPSNPTRPATAQYTYTFTGWSGSYTNITGDVTVTAQYSSTVNKYTVTFKDWDGTVLKTQSVEYGANATAPSNPSRPATAQYTYTFTGWSGSYTNVKANVTVTAQYSSVVNKYTVTFKDWNGTVIKTQSVEYGSNATAPANPTRTGYTFTGWSGSYTNIKGNVTVTATYSINTYTVTFKDWDGTVIKTQSVEYGKGATAPANPTRTGYTFKGWDKSFSSITANTVVTATYTINSYTVTFKDYDGTVLSSGKVNYGSAASAPSDPYRVGYKFTGWDKDFSNITGNLIVTAKYEEIVVNLVGGFNDWNAVTGQMKLESDKIYTLTLKLNPGSYDFKIISDGTWLGNWGDIEDTTTATSAVGWEMTSDAGDCTLIASGGTYTFTFNTETRMLVIDYEPIYYTVVFKNYDGTVLSTQTIAIGRGATAPTDPSRPADAQYTYTFSGWDKDFSKVQSDLTVNAQYSTVLNKYTVTFVDYDGKELKTQTVEYGKSATAPANPTRTGYTFAGWDKAYTNIKGNTTITATYTINSYTVTFKDWDGRTLSSQTVNYGSDATAPANPTRTGYTFAGWDKSYKNITDNITITATYTINKYTVTFKDYDGTTLATREVNHGSAATAPSDPVRAGYKFTGWDKSFSNITGNLTVTAQYSEIIINLVGGFNGWDTTAGKMTMTSDNVYTLTLDIDAGSYLFKVISDGVWLGNNGTIENTTTNTSSIGWEMDANAGDCTLSASGGTYTFRYNYSTKMLEILYKAAQYTVTFKDWDGKVLSTQTVEAGNAATAPASPTRTGYTFKGWDKSFSNITGNTTVTATYTINSYTVTFVDYDGKELKTQTVEYGKSATAPSDPVRAGYKFTGWDKAFSNITGNLTVTAKYEEIVVNLVGDFNGWSTETGKMTMSSDNVYTLTLDIDAGSYLFKVISDGVWMGNWGIIENTTTTSSDIGWEMDTTAGDCTLKASGGTYTFTYNAVTKMLVVTYKAAQYTVTFVDFDSKVLSTQTVEAGKGATAPASPTRTGYTFAGWDKSFASITADTVVTATYTINSYTVTFKDYDGKVLATRTVEYGSAAAAPSDPVRPGYVFTGWDKDFSNITGNLTVTAKYQEIIVNLLGDFNNWSTETGKMSMSSDNVYTISLDIAPGTYKFKILTDDVWYGNTGTIENTTTTSSDVGWEMTADTIDCTLNASGGAYTFTYNTVTRMLVVTYEADRFTVTFKDWDGRVIKSEAVEAGKSATAPSDPTRTGYTFTGWDKDFSNITGGLTVTAQYTINYYTVKFVDYDNTVISTQTVAYGQSATAPKDPTRESDGQYTYTFAGWDKPYTSITADTTIKATYSTEGVYYTVTFADFDGTVLKTETVAYGASATAPEVPTREGYTFTGWDKGFANVNSNITVTAVYTVNTFTVTFKDPDGKEIDSQTVNYGEAAVAPEAPARNGYKFTGWDKEFYNITADLTVTAQYEEILVNLLGDFNSWSTEKSKMTLTTDNVFTMTIDLEAGNYLFKILTDDIWYGNDGVIENTTLATSAIGWEMIDGAGNCTLKASGGTYTFNYNYSTRMLEVLYEAARYTVTFVDSDGTVLSTQTVEAGNAATAPEEPTREGYTFTGWDKEFTNITADTVVTATYQVITYKVTFADYNGTVLKEETVEHGQSATAPDAPVRDGYLFTGWDKEYDNITASITITATYKEVVADDPNVYLVGSFNDWATNTVMTQSGDVVSVTLELEPGTYLFKILTNNKWYGNYGVIDDTTIKTSDIGWEMVDGAGNCTLNATGGFYTFNFNTETRMLEVVCEINYFTVTFVNYDGKVIETQTIKKGSGATAPAATPTREADAQYTYTFAGWDTDFSDIQGAVTVKATYSQTLNKYNVTFVNYDGTVLKTEEVEYGKGATAPADPEKPAIGECYYTFAGWDKDFANITGDITVTAQFTANGTEYTVIFKDWDNTVLSTQSVVYGNSATAPEDPTREGTAQYSYVFTGWDGDYSSITEDTTLTAMYTPVVNTYTVTFTNYDGTVLKTQLVAYGSSATPPANPEREATSQYTYKFAGWDKSYTNITGNTTVKATYTASVNTNSSSTGIYNLAGEVQQGQILQTWCWSYNNIRANLQTIASQGFSAIQVSPIQPIKESTRNGWNTLMNSSWVIYQPVGFTIENNSFNAQGTKSEFQAMCAEAHKYGIKVIVDVVFNHTANDMSENTIHPWVPSDLRDNPDCWHDITKTIYNFDNRYEATHYCLSGLPDLNTAHPTVQWYAASFLKEAIAAGADGFRFDAAKHIETDWDADGTKSDFWMNVLGEATSYAQSTRGFTPYYYGEILGGAGGGLGIGAYTRYMSLTETSSNDIRYSITQGNAAGAVIGGLYQGESSDKAVMFTETHDTYKDSGTRFISDANINKTWAIVGARANVCGLYLARPYNIETTLMGAADITSWSYPEVRAVNQFKNHFIGQGEYLSSYNSLACVERGNSGIVIVNTGGTYYNGMRAPVHTMADGVYKDSITGNTFTVSGGWISGDIGDTGIAVVYQAADKGTFTTGNLTDLSLVGSFNDWDAAANKLVAGSDSTASTVVYLDAGTYSFKLTTDSGLWYSNTGTITDSTGSTPWTMYTNVSGDCTLKASGGKYTFTFNSLTGKLSVDYQANADYSSNVYLKGTFNNWGTDNRMYYTGTNNIVTTTMNLPAGTYSFKLNDLGYGVWYSNTGTINDTTATGGSSGWNMYTSVAGDCTLVTTGGTYTFMFNMSTHKLVVLHQPYTYTVVFKDWDGTIISSQTVEHGSAAIAPQDPERENDGTYAYIFSGWDKEFSSITEDMTITAQYASAANSYAVIFKDYDGTVISSQLVEAGSSATAPASPSREETDQYRYLFLGWDTDFTNITADTVVTAQYKIITKQYTVTFVDFDGTVIGTSTVDYGTSAVAPADPTREGTAQYSYVFTGWSKDFSVVTESFETVAEYEELTNYYTVTFTDYDGTTISAQTVAYGTAATAPEAPAREGYLFTGWDADYSYITGNLYVAATYEKDIVYLRGDFNGWGTNDVMNATENDNIVSVTLTLEKGRYTFKLNRVTSWYGNAGTIDDTTLATSDIGWEMSASEDTNCTLNASGGYYTFIFNKETAFLEILYTPFVYTVTFVDFDGTVLKTEEVNIGKSATAPEDPVRDGFAFTGWDTDFSEITADLTVTATYQEAAENEYVITFVDYDGTVLAQTIVERGKAATAPEDPTRAGNKQYTYTFAGWDADFSCVTSDMTVTATYTETVNSYTVKFTDWDGTVLSEQVVEYGSTVTAPDAPAREADAQYTYTFTGWDKDFSEISEDLTITAQYDAAVNSYTVTFVDWDGDILGSESVEYGKGATAPKTPLRKGYLFTSWDKDFTNITADLTVTAQYEEDIVYLRGFDGDWTTGLELVATENEDVVSVKLTLEAGTYSFKLYRVGMWYSNGGTIADTTLATSSIGWQMSTDPSLTNCTLTATGGTYTFNFNKSTNMLEVLHSAPTFTVTFVDFDGTVLGTEQVERGKAATAPADPVRDGFAFTGWDTDFTNITEDITVTATYKELDENEFIVIFTDFDGTVIDTQIVTKGEAAIAPKAPERAADAQYTYIFSGWDKDFTSITSDLTITAKYDAVLNKYTVTFMDQDGSVIDTQTVEYGKSATAPADPEREGYVFKGWSADFSEITGNITIVAQYDKDLVYLAGTFNEWSETGTVLSATENEDVVSVTMDLKEGTYSFKMIYLGQWYGNAGVIEDTTLTTSSVGWEMSNLVGDNCTLKASGGTYTFNFNKSTKMLEVIYLAPSFTVTFVDFDGTVLKTEVVERGKAATAPQDPVRDDFAFIGWDKNFSNVTSDMTVTAQYAEDAVYLVGSWSDWALDTEMSITETDDVVSVTLTLSEGKYQFKILNVATWFGNTGSVDDTTINTSETGWIMVEGNDNCTLNATGGTYTFNYNRTTNTLEILFTPPSFTVTFVDWNGNVLKTETVERGKGATAPADPEREGYSFQGWNKDFSYIYTNTVVTATYLQNEITYTVTFLDYDGTVLDVQIVKTDEAATAPEVPARENFEFIGWDKDFSRITYNLTVTARYVDTRVYLVGTFTDWTTNTQMAEKEGDIVSAEVMLGAGTHNFKILYKDVWYTNTGVIEDTTTKTSEIGWEMITDPSAGDCTLITTGGKYTFNYNTETHFLEILYTPVEFTVTFTDYDGTELSSQTIKLGADATAPEAPTREGYIFTGWDKDFTKVEADTVVTAVYVEDTTQYTVTFVDFDGTVLSTQYVGYGKAAAAPAAPERAGYVFTGWDKDFSGITGDTTVTAQYKDNTVYLYGSFNMWAEGMAMTFTEGSSIVTYEMTLPAGRYFFKLLNLDNWYGNAGNIIDTTITTSDIGWEMVAGADNCSLTTSGGKYTFNFNLETKMLEVLYAPLEYKVVFRGLSGEILSTQMVKHGAAAVAPETPVINGYIFSEWDTDISAITEDTEVTAIYIKDDAKLTVTFTDYDGTVIYVAEVGFGEDATAPQDPVRVGYIFLGWDKEFTNITKNTVVTAQYKDNQLYLVGSWGDWATDTSMSREGTSDVFTVSVALEAGSYEFKLLQNDVWYTSASTVLDTTKLNSATGIELRTNLALGNIILNATGGLYTFRFNVATNKLEVLHSADTFTVTFVDYDGRVISTQTVIGGCAATAPEAPTRESDAQYSYTFKSWDKDFSNITADMTITAVYSSTVNKYNVVFVDTDGTVLSTQEVEYGKSATEPEAPMKNGFIFQGWDTDFTNITGDTVVTAKYMAGVASSVTLAGTFNDWNAAATPFLVTGNSDKVTLQLKLAEGTYKFKVVDSGNWFGNWGTIADTTVTTSDIGWEMDASAGDCTLIAGGGTYIFTYTISTHMLEVVYVGSEFKVTFVDWDGTVLKTEVVEPGGSATAPNVSLSRPADDGYTYVWTGWDMDFTNVIAPLRVTAVYKATPKMYTVTFKNWNGAVLKTQSVAYGTAATPPANPTRAGYIFTGWDGDIWYITGNTTFTAQYADNGVYIMGDFNDWQGTKLTLVSGTTYQGKIYLAPGQYKFKVKQGDSWYGNNGWIDDTTTYTSDVGWEMSWDAGDCTLNASGSTYTFRFNTSTRMLEILYVAPTYTVTFKNWNGSVLKTQYVKRGNPAYAPADPTRSGYVFTGWDRDFSWIYENTVVTAQFAKNEVSLMGEMTSWDTGKTMVPAGGNIYTTTLDLSAGTYKFKIKHLDTWYGNGGTIENTTLATSAIGWEMVWDQGDCTLNATGGTYTFRFNTETRMLEILFKGPSYTVTFVDWDGSIISTQRVEYGKSATAPQAPEREGYTFSGWSADFSFITGNTTIMAQYGDEAVYLRGTFNDWSLNSPMRASDNPKVYTYVMNLTSGEYKFKVFRSDVWYGNDGNIADSTIHTSATGWEMSGSAGDCTLTAQGGTYLFRFNIDTRMLEILRVTDEVTVTFKDFDGTILDTQTVKYGAAAVAPKTPVREGYEFTGWDKAIDYVTESITVTALYRKTVKLNASFATDAVQMTAKESGKYAVTVRVEAGTHSLGINYGGVTYGADSTFADAASGIILMAGSEDKCTFIATGGIYRLTFDTETGALIVEKLSDSTDDEITPDEPERPSTGDEIGPGGPATGDESDPSTGDEIDPDNPSTGDEIDPDDPPVVEPELPEIGEITHTVIFVDKNGNILSEQTVKDGESAIAPDPPAIKGYEFTGWNKTFDAVTGDLIVTAQYKRLVVPVVVTTGILQIDVISGTGFKISIDKGALRPQGLSYYNSKATIGATVTVVANSITGKEFVGWVNAKNGIVLTNSLTYTFITTGNDHIKAMYMTDYLAMNSVMFLNDKAAMGSGQIHDMQYYTYGDVIAFPADPVQAGFDFAGWDMTPEQIQQKLLAGEDVTVRALWIKQDVYYAVTIIGGTGTGTTNSAGNYLANTKIRLTASAAPAGMKFAYWTVDGEIKSYEETFNFYPTKASTAEAVFVLKDAEIDYQILIGIDTVDTTTAADKNTFYYSWYIPEEELGVTFVSAGILAVNKNSYTGENLVIGTTDPSVYNRTAPATANGIYSWTKTKVSEGDTWVAKAYVQYKVEGSDEILVIYSDMVEVTK